MNSNSAIDVSKFAAQLSMVIVLAIAGQQSFAQQLQWKLAPDDQFTVQFVQQTSSNTTVSDRTTTVESATTLVMDWKVTKVDDQKNAVIEQAISAVQLTAGDPAVPNKLISFDTTSTEKPSRESATILEQIKPLIGLKFIVTMSPAGEIVAVSMPDDTMKVLRDLPGSLQLQALFSEQGLKDLIGVAAVVLPNDDFQVGQSWETNAAVENSFGSFDRKRIYTYKGTDEKTGRELASIELQTTMNPTKAATESDAGKLLEFAETGIMQMDNAAGYFTSSKTESITKTQLPYREKLIETTVTNSIYMTIVKK